MASPERDICDQVGQHVVGLQQHVHDLVRRDQLAVAHGIEHGLEDMGEVDEPLEAEDAGAAFDRMHGAEDRIDRVVGTGPSCISVSPASICCSASLHSSKKVSFS